MEKIFKGYKRCRKMSEIFLFIFTIEIQKVIHLEFWQR